MTKYDLHTHTNCSDGSDSPLELLMKAKEIGLDGISITDHDTISAYTPQLFEKAALLGLDLITGVEFSTQFEETTIHVLGYCYDIHSPLIKEFCKRHVERRRDRNSQMIEKLQKLGISISLDEINRDHNAIIGRPHIAEVMVKKGYALSIQDAFNQWLGDGKPGYVQGEFFDLQETIAIIQNSGGKAILAHPILISKKALLRKIKKFDFDGWECFYAKFSFEQNNEMAKIADNYGFIKTGGSDYHGEIKPLNKLGSAYTDAENIERLKSRDE